NDVTHQIALVTLTQGAGSGLETTMNPGQLPPSLHAAEIALASVNVQISGDPSLAGYSIFALSHSAGATVNELLGITSQIQGGGQPLGVINFNGVSVASTVMNLLPGIDGITVDKSQLLNICTDLDPLSAGLSRFAAGDVRYVGSLLNVNP